MGKNRKTIALLCLATFSLGLSLVGCGGSKNVVHTITFETNGGSAIDPLSVKHGEVATKPNDPTKSGFNFVDWYEDSVLVTPFDFSLPITANWTIYAKWQAGSPVDPPTPGPEEGYTYTCNNLPDWITNDGAVIFAWAWEAGKDGSWISCTYGEGTKPTELSFKVDNELEGFLLARCAAGTTTPDWKQTTDGPGRVYNKTADISCSAGVYTYKCSDWIEIK